jgi:Tfp pilus assembly protein PilO
MKKTPVNFKDLYKIYTKKYPEIFKIQERRSFIAYFYVTLTLITLSLFGVFAIMPTLTTISNLRKQYSDNELVYENLKTKLQNIEALEGQYQGLLPQIQKLDKAIPASPEIPTLVRQIETLAELHSLSIITIEIGTIEVFPTTQKNPPVYSYTIQMNLQGNETSVNSFIEEAINFERIMGIDSIATGVGKDSSEVAITGRVYFYAKK